MIKYRQNFLNMNKTNIKILLFVSLFALFIFIPFNNVKAACGDTIYNPFSPEFEECDMGIDGSWSPGCYTNTHPVVSERCKARPGWFCDGNCTLLCGNGNIDAGEVCDSGINNGKKNGFSFTDLSVPPIPAITTNPTLANAYQLPSGTVVDTVISGNIAYLAAWNGGLYIIDISNPSAPNTLSSITFGSPALGLSIVNNFAYVALANGLQIVDVSVPSSPQLRGSYSTGITGEDIVIVGNYAYLTNSTLGISILDISNPNAPTFIRNISGFRASRLEMVNNINILYVVGGDTPQLTRISNINNPATASVLGTPLNTIGNATDVVVSGNYAFVSALDSGLVIINTTTGTVVSQIDFINASRGIGISGNYVYVANGGGGFEIVNITNPYNPIIAGSYTPTSNAEDVTIYGNYAYVSDWNDGIKIVQIKVSGLPNYCNATCNGYVSSTCGDGFSEGGALGIGTEQCDEAQNNNVACSAPYGSSCNHCSNLCTNTNTIGNYCGDGTITGPEDCDGSLLNGNTCSTLGFEGGNLTCLSCSFNTTGCYSCGNNIREGSEICDNGPADSINCNFDSPGSIYSCTAATCGDNYINTVAGEECESTIDTALCDGAGAISNEECTLPVCGDGHLNTLAGEECDDSNNINGDGCNSDCTIPICGNGITEAPEICDDGDTLNTGNCNATCTSTTYCGDNNIQNPNATGNYEQCEPPNVGACNAACLFPVCGNYWLDLGEECDQWITTPHPDTPTCDANCTNRACNDSYLNSNEVCDQSAPNPFRGSTCASLTAGDPIPRTSGNLTCTTCSAIDTNDCYSCGNGIIEGPEYCDDGNTVNGDGCANNCFAPFTPGWSCGTNPFFNGTGTPPESLCALLCGNGNIDAGEACDDNNNITETVNNCTYGVPSCTFCNNDCSQILNFVAPYCGNNSVDTINAGADGIYGNNDDNEEACDLGASLNNNPNCSYGLTSCNTCLTNCSVSQPGITSYCGDGIYDPANEDCEYDTGAPGTSGDGCSSSCTVETGYACGNFGPGGAYTCSFHCGADANGDGNNIDVNFDINGDGIIDINEQCDNGNLNGIRCIADTYGLNCNWCTNSCETRTVTGAYCGDGQINQPYEACDQGNTTSGDGCSATCQIENGWQCSGTRDSRCNTISGDGVCVGAPYESCINNFNDCGACSFRDILTALPGQTNNAFNDVLKSISNILPIPQLRIKIPGLDLNESKINKALEFSISIGPTLFGPNSRTPFFVGERESFITIDAINATDDTIDITFE